MALRIRYQYPSARPWVIDGLPRAAAELGPIASAEARFWSSGRPFAILNGGEVSEWFMVPLSKSGVRKHRGFESHPLRQPRNEPRAGRRAGPSDLPERSPRGLGRRTGNAVWGNPSRVRIPPSPPALLSCQRRARRGTSGALYLQSAPAGPNPHPRSAASKAALWATLKTGSRAAAAREPGQVRKEAALSDIRRVPRSGTVRADRREGRGVVPIDGGCTARFLPVARARCPA